MRRRIPRAILPLAAVALVAALSAADTTSAEVVRFSGRVNELRRAAGCGPLEWDRRVAAVAQAHSENMARHDSLDHADADGADMKERLRRAGYVRRGPAAENISYGQFNVDEALAGWVGSPGHRENLEYCRFTHHGLGRQGPYWTHVLVTLGPDQVLPPLPTVEPVTVPVPTLRTHLAR